MAKLIYSVIASLDGYIEDQAARFAVFPSNRVGTAR